MQIRYINSLVEERKKEREYIGNRFNITSLNEWKIYL